MEEVKKQHISKYRVEKLMTIQALEDKAIKHGFTPEDVSEAIARVQKRRPSHGIVMKGEPVLYYHNRIVEMINNLVPTSDMRPRHEIKRFWEYGVCPITGTRVINIYRPSREDKRNKYQKN